MMTPICPTCGLPAQADIVQAFADLRAHADLLESKLAHTIAEGRKWQDCAETLAKVHPIADTATFAEWLARTTREARIKAQTLEPIHT